MKLKICYGFCLPACFQEYSIWLKYHSWIDIGLQLNNIHGLHSLKQKECQKSIELWIFDDPSNIERQGLMTWWKYQAQQIFYWKLGCWGHEAADFIEAAEVLDAREITQYVNCMQFLIFMQKILLRSLRPVMLSCLLRPLRFSEPLLWSGLRLCWTRMIIVTKFNLGNMLKAITNFKYASYNFKDFEIIKYFLCFSTKQLVCSTK